MQLKRAIEQFLEGYFATCERSPKTISAYRIDLTQAIKFLGARTHVEKIAPEKLESWAQRLKDENYAPASIRRKFASLRMFFNYWLRRGLIDSSPLWRIRLDLKKARELPKVLNLDEVRSILDTARKKVGRIPTHPIKQIDPRFLALRNLALVEVLFATGIRIGELAALRQIDYEPATVSLTIRGKGNRQRLAILPDAFCTKVLERYAASRVHVLVDSDHLFLNRWGNALSTQGAANAIATLVHGSTVRRHVTPHMFRHTVATLLLRNGADIRVVQEFLGHASINTTQRYTHVTKEHLSNTLRAHHPNRIGLKRTWPIVPASQ